MFRILSMAPGHLPGRLLLCLLTALIVVPARAGESLCLDGERVAFACELDGQLLAVCSSADFSARSGYIQFRYGRPGRLAAAWPPPETPREGVSKGGLILAGRLGTYLRFNVEHESYVIFSMPDDLNGLVVSVDGAIRSKRFCRRTSVAELETLPVARSAVFAVTGSRRR